MIEQEKTWTAALSTPALVLFWLMVQLLRIIDLATIAPLSCAELSLTVVLVSVTGCSDLKLRIAPPR